MQPTVLFLLAASVVNVWAFGGSEDRFIKKYAMMKIYESCFGPEVVKQIRKEMKSACAKCAALETSPGPPPTIRPSPQMPPLQDGGHSGEPENSIYSSQPSFDPEKLHQAILAYRPHAYPAPSYRPFSPASGFYPFSNPALYQTNPLFFQSAFQQPGHFSPYSFPIVGQPFFSGGHRMSRDMDIKSQLEALTSRMTGRVKNVTCVMQELGYLDENLEPNYRKISERIGNLPVPDDLKRDMQDGVTFCQQFSQCVPDIKKDRSPLSRELIRPMFFFKCYKHKKLEACVMKDVREKYAGVSDEELDEDVEIRRQGKSSKLSNDGEIEELASSMYDFLYGSDSNIDLDTIL